MIDSEALTLPPPKKSAVVELVETDEPGLPDRDWFLQGKPAFKGAKKIGME